MLSVTSFSMKINGLQCGRRYSQQGLEGFGWRKVKHLIAKKGFILQKLTVDESEIDWQMG